MTGHERLVDVLAGFAQTLTRPYATGDVLHALTERMTQLLALTGAGVTLSEAGRVQFVTAQGSGSHGSNACRRPTSPAPASMRCAPERP